MTEDLQKELLSLHNIIKNGDSYELQNNYYKDENCIVAVIPYKDRDNHNCFKCSHFISMNEFDGYCDIYNS